MKKELWAYIEQMINSVKEEMKPGEDEELPPQPITISCTNCGKNWVSSLPFAPFRCLYCDQLINEYIVGCSEFGELVEEVSTCCLRPYLIRQKVAICSRCDNPCDIKLRKIYKKPNFRLISGGRR